LTRAALKTIDGDHDGRPLEHFYEAVQQTFMIVGSWLEVFFKNALRIPDSLNTVLGRSLVETPRNINQELD
jgi:hypothetical protein